MLKESLWIFHFFSLWTLIISLQRVGKLMDFVVKRRGKEKHKRKQSLFRYEFFSGFGGESSPFTLFIVNEDCARGSSLCFILRTSSPLKFN